MRAYKVFEKFKEQSDPLDDMGLTYSTRTLGSKSWKILEFIESKGEEGASLKEIQHFIWIFNGGSEEDFLEKRPISTYNYNTGHYYETKARRTRGYWNTNLLGGGGHKGILYKFCVQNPKTKKWIFKRYPDPQEILYDWPKRPK